MHFRRIAAVVLAAGATARTPSRSTPYAWAPFNDEADPVSPR